LILIDTSAFIEFLNKTGSPFDREIESLISKDKETAIADIVLTEVLQGIKNDKDYVEVKKSLLSFPVYSLKGIDSFIAAADLYRKSRKKGLTIRNTIDLLIAQIAIENNLILLHNDRDFDTLAHICNLRIQRLPSQPK
jgi:predicted nucleic acid-binding protein